MSSFVQVRGRWWWHVIGKGRKEAQVPVNQDMLQALRDYRRFYLRRFYGLPPLPAPDETTPLVLNLKGTGGIGDNMIYRIVKDLVAKAAARWKWTIPIKPTSCVAPPPTGSAIPASLTKPMLALQRNARHARIDTTGLYLHAEEKEWHETMERHRLKE